MLGLRHFDTRRRHAKLRKDYHIAFFSFIYGGRDNEAIKLLADMTDINIVVLYCF